MPTGKIYEIGKNRILQGNMQGFVCEESKALRCTADEPLHTLFLRGIDGGARGGGWGRFSLRASVEEGTVYALHAFACDDTHFMRNGVLTSLDDFLTDPLEPLAKKRLLFERQEALSFINREDMLLYGLAGRFLFLFFEAKGTAGGSFDSLRVDLEGDHFMQTFPQVYQERNSFLHRYLSVFSSLYKDFGERIERAHTMPDADSAPASLLPELGSWLGLDLRGGFLEEEKLRLLVREAGRLNRGKGTKRAMERLTEIVLGEKAVILERNLMEPYIAPQEYENFGRLYGDSPWDITLLIRTGVPQNRRARLLFLLEQFKPVRSRLKPVFLETCGELDSYCYLDVNAQIFVIRNAALDENGALDAGRALQGADSPSSETGHGKH